MMDDLYSELIVDHYKNPRNFGDLEGFTHKGKGANASCGDMLEVYMVIENDDLVDIKFKGIGCALSTASASMLTEKIKEEKMGVKDILKMNIDDLQILMGIEVSPTRMKCVSLSLRTVQDMLEVK